MSRCRSSHCHPTEIARETDEVRPARDVMGVDAVTGSPDWNRVDAPADAPDHTSLAARWPLRSTAVTPDRSPTPDPGEMGALLDRHLIHEVVLRYCRGIDRMQRDLVASCFHPDATDTHGSFRGTVQEFLDWAFRLLERYDATMHLVANHLAEIGGDTAVTETYGVAHHRSSDPDPRRNLTVGFRYIDRFERREDRVWRIAERIATTEWVDSHPPTSRWPLPADSAIGRRDDADPLWRMLADLRAH